jgi:Glyoxalase superfamily protein/Clp amino terminal domain, pathogenicity island component
MRDFRDSKVMAQTLRAALAAKGHKISISESLELIAKAFGAADWNTLAATIKTAAAQAEGPEPADKPIDNNHVLDNLAQLLGVDDWDKLRAVVHAARPPAPADAPQTPPSTGPAPRRSVGTSFSFALERSLHRAVELATIRKHEYTTLEHLLLALIDDADAAETMQACGADLRQLSERLTSYIDDELQQLVTADSQVQAPTAGFHRVIQRAVIHVQSSGRDQVTGANVLVAIFSERESQAAYFLQQQEISRNDAVNFIAHGIRKDGGKAA